MNTIQEAALLPYALSGGQGSSAAQLLELFELELDGFAPPTESGCQAGLIARVSGHQGRESAFIQRLERATKTLDIKTLRTFIDTFNVQATASINTIDFYPSTAARKAVGN
ncbi:MAG: hypothetical protein L3K26_01620 [Candidatus Hydrogenedentes bacterium]|nr:hypothetical protein [Candidatus Hydrogenedentota bacterium]